jgi:uncharacterized protein
MRGALPRSLADRSVFLDASCFLALANQRDSYHAEAVAIWTRLVDERWQAITTNFVVAETHALFIVRLGRGQALSFLERIDASSTTVARVTVQDEARAREIVRRYVDRDFSLTDALSFSVMERLRVAVAFTFDRHFTQYGLRVAGVENC